MDGAWLWNITAGLPWAFIGAGFFGFAIPILLLAVRHEVRIRRLQLIEEFKHSFATSDTPDGGGVEKTPSFGFVRSKYIADLKHDPVVVQGLQDDDRVATRLSAAKKLTPIPESRKEESEESYYRLIEVVAEKSWFRFRSNRRLLYICMPFMLLSFYGFLVAFATVTAV